jgi:hypothetical protein
MAGRLASRLYNARKISSECPLALGKLYGQAGGLISTGQLNTLLCLHTQPINVVVFHESHREYSSLVGLHA